MKDGPNIAKIAALLGDTARANALTALMTDRALTATELAAIAGVTKQTMSAHLSKLLDAALIAVEQQGRHRYFRLADEDVGDLLESLMGVAFRTGAVRLLSSPREPALRKTRVCYDHLAGELGVLAYDARVSRGRRGWRWCSRVGMGRLRCRRRDGLHRGSR
jgi:DNA-binding transcriptional ArsR family regulator